MRVAITGELQTRTFADKDGNNRKVYEVLVNTIEFADGKREVNASSGTTTTANSNTFASTVDDDFVPVDVEGLPWE